MSIDINDKDYKYYAFVAGWRHSDKSHFDAYMRLGVTYFYNFDFSNLDEIIESLKAQYKEGQSVQELEMFGEPAKLIVPL